MSSDVAADLSDPVANRAVAARMQAAASEWIASLAPEQRPVACWPAPGQDAQADAERVMWFYVPTDHGGLRMADQRPAQHQLVMRLLDSGLSTAGYMTVSAILGWENILDQVEGFGVSWGRERGRDPGMYYLRVFGDPATDQVWGWRFGGHHVSLNFLVVDGLVVASTPCFLGLDPAAVSVLGDVPLRPLGTVEDLARDLVRSLSPGLRRDAVLLEQAPSDLVGGNRPRLADGDEMLSLPLVWRGRFTDPDLAARVDAVSRAAEERAGVTPAGHSRLAITSTPKGIPGSALDQDQRAMLSALVRTYTGRVREAVAPALDVDTVHLAWAGSMAPGEPHYYRLQGPRFLAEWDNTQRDGNHAHSVWRDPQRDFGLDVLASHRATHHGG